MFELYTHLNIGNIYDCFLFDKEGWASGSGFQTNPPSAGLRTIAPATSSKGLR